MWPFSSINSLRKNFVNSLLPLEPAQLNCASPITIFYIIKYYYDGAISIQVTSYSQMANTIMH